MSEEYASHWPETVGGPKHRITVLGVPMRVWRKDGTILAVGDKLPDNYAISGDVRTAARVIICGEYEAEIEKKLEKRALALNSETGTQTDNSGTETGLSAKGEDA